MTESSSIIDEITHKLFRWLGHVLRKKNSSITKTALRWTPQGKRPRGRPKTTWRRTIENELKYLKMTWGEAKTMEKKRPEWRGLVLTLCSDRSEEDNSMSIPLFQIDDLCVCRGFEDAHGVDLFDVEAISDGNIKNKYTYLFKILIVGSGIVFVDKSHITKESPFYRRDPKLHDRIHCVAIVMDANNDPDYPMTERVQEQIKKTQELMNQKGVPHLILMNEIDGLSESVRGDLSKIFHNQEVKERLEKLAHSLRLPPYTVLPMKNIDTEQCINTHVNILAL